ncbi:MAG: DUF47 family protein [Bacteroidales bacterium]|nr:DUF47 family protein [Bacteroidales bacterium]
MRFNTIFQFFVPKDDKFITLFEKASTNLLEASEVLKELIVTEDVALRNEMVQQIKDIERKGDDITHRIFEELNKNFITPFDREDIQSLTSSIDDVLDNINGACYKIKLYKPKKITTDFNKMCECLNQCAIEISIAVYELRYIKNSKKILQSCININSFENIADDLYHNYLTFLFDNEKDAIELIKMKEIMQNFERAVDCAENVSDVIKSIIIKNS